MDRTTRRIAEFAASLRFQDLPAAVVHDARRRVIDTIACGLGGRDCDAVKIGQRISGGAAPRDYVGRILSFDERTTAESAAFTNSCMTRYLDYNDTYPGGHPSDGIGALLALVDHPNVTAERFLTGLVVHYEVFTRISKAAQLRELGWDQGFATAVGVAAGTGHMLGLDAERLAHAISITIVSNNHLRATRAGNLSLWKGAACGFATRNGVYTALLAAEGMTGPEAPIEGRHGLWQQITREFDLLPFPNEGGDYLVNIVRLKYWPVEYNAQIGVFAALDLRSKMPVEAIDKIEIGTYWSAWHEIGSEPAKWDPKSRETADHSLPYIFARALVDGTVTISSFDSDRISDPSLRPLMNKISVREDPAIEALWPDVVAISVTATSTSGDQISIKMENPRGHENNPMSDEEISNKFNLLCAPVLGAAASADVLSRFWLLGSNVHLPALFDALVPRGTSEQRLASMA